MFDSIIGGAVSAVGNLVGGGSSSTGGIDDAIGQMRDAFNEAIASAAEVTALTTEKKAELDAAKQRPNI